jgi:hypothetical protein
MLLEQNEGKMSQGPEVLDTVTATDPMVVLAERHVHDPMATVFNLSVRRNCTHYRFCCA